MPGPNLTSPLADAMARMDAAMRAWTEGPWTTARRLAAKVDPEAPSSVPFQDVAKWTADLMRAWGISTVQFAEAVAILAKPPTPFEIHRIALPATVDAAAVTDVTVVANSLVWTAPPAFTPKTLPDASVVDPPAGTPETPGTVWVRLTPAVSPLPTKCSLTLRVVTGGEPVEIGVGLTSATRWIA